MRVTEGEVDMSFVFLLNGTFAWLAWTRFTGAPAGPHRAERGSVSDRHPNGPRPRAGSVRRRRIGRWPKATPGRPTATTEVSIASARGLRNRPSTSSAPASRDPRDRGQQSGLSAGRRKGKFVPWMTELKDCRDGRWHSLIRLDVE